MHCRRPKAGLPLHTLTLIFENPLDGFDTNTAMAFSLNQAYGKLDDYFGIRLHGDKNFARRLLHFFSSLWFMSGIEYYSHEIAHEYEVRRIGLKKGFRLGPPAPKRLLWPEFIQDGGEYYRRSSNKEIFRTIVNGLNQEELNAYHQWHTLTGLGVFSLHDAPVFFGAKIFDNIYILIEGLEDRFPPNRNLSNLDVVYYAVKHDLVNDVDEYSLLSYNNNVQLTKRQFLIQSLLADLLSWQTWHSLYAGIRYIVDGTRTFDYITINIKDKVRISPPLINLYLTSGGSFFDFSFYIGILDDYFLYLSLGMELSLLFKNKVDTNRFGASFKYIRLWEFRFAPYFYLNVYDSRRFRGISTGLTAGFLPVANVMLFSRFEYNHQDIIENRVKGKKEGFYINFGVDIIF